MTVISMSKVPHGVRGYLSRWVVEIDTGVYIGNFNSRVREQLWTEITSLIRQGEATIAYRRKGDQGFAVEVSGGPREARDHDGVTLIWKPSTR
jgi:CRISPR-associated protein Cas2